MANAIFSNVQVRGNRRIDLAGSFQPNGASTSLAGIKGGFFTVAHTAGANTYTVTFSDTFPDYDAAFVQMSSPTLGQSAQITGEPTVGSTKQLVIAVHTAGAANNDVAFNANTRIHFWVRMKNSSLTGRDA